MTFIILDNNLGFFTFLLSSNAVGNLDFNIPYNNNFVLILSITLFLNEYVVIQLIYSIYNTIKKIKRLNISSKLYAVVGPCIGKKSYEVDKNFYKMFLSKSRKNKTYFSIKNKTKRLFNLRKFVTNKLVKSNIKVDQVDRDTFVEKSNFFSFRRSCKLKQKDYGRCISSICMPELN